jgi:hypothetical protein
MVQLQVEKTSLVLYVPYTVGREVKKIGMKLNRKLFLLFGVSVFLTACSSLSTVAPEPTPSALNQEVTSPAVTEDAQPTIELVATEDGQLVSELTESEHQVEYKEYDFGVMVQSIDGLAADSDHFWALYVNDAFGEAGATQLTVNQGDRVKWVYEELK